MKTGNPSITLIIGPKHSGKSQCSRLLGKIMDWEVVDMDDFIEKQTGKTPRTLFNEGPEIFRKAEVFALAALIQPPEAPDGPNSERSGRIIATGGGLIDNPEALALLAESPAPFRCRGAICVYLDVSAETAWQRILDSAAGRELPPFLNTENPKETHFTLHKRRSESYKALAHLIISAENKTPNETAEEIAERIKELKPGFIPVDMGG